MNMNSKQLFFALHSNCTTQPFFDGVFARDQLEEIIMKPQLVIVNSEPSDSEGKHWVLFFFKGQSVDFFDSLGKDISAYHPDFANFIDRYSLQTNYLNVRIQPPRSSICGQYCLYYAYKCCQCYDMEEIVKSMECSEQVVSFVNRQFILCKNSLNKLQSACEM